MSQLVESIYSSHWFRAEQNWAQEAEFQLAKKELLVLFTERQNFLSNSIISPQILKFPWNMFLKFHNFHHCAFLILIPVHRNFCTYTTTNNTKLLESLKYIYWLVKAGCQHMFCLVIAVRNWILMFRFH